MDNPYAPLFQKSHIGAMTLKNKFVLSPMGTQYTEPDGRMSEKSINFYLERAKGGVGMIITEALFPTRTTGASHYIGDASCLPRLAELTDLVHGYGTKICAQLGAGNGRIDVLSPEHPIPPSASPVPAHYNPKVLCHELSIDEINERVAAFTPAAKRMVVAGFDAVEIHAHAGYLVDQFMSSEWNHRTDEYGGSIENKMRFATDIIKAVRKGVGPNFPILFRMAVDHKYPGGRDLKESIRMAQIVEEAGADALDIDAGCYGSSFYWLFPPTYEGDASMLDLATAIKKAVSIPVLNSGTHTPETALKAIEEGNIDFVMMGRPLLADPYLPNKLKAGHREDIRPCIRCNEFCVNQNLFMQKSLTCGVNVDTGHENMYKIEKSDLNRSVAVIGGGPAGLEAARISALKGYNVTVYEKSDHLGGNSAVAATPDFKTIDALLTWFEHQMEKLNVTVCLNTEIRADSPELKSADEIFIAVGGYSWAPPISGIDLPLGIDVCDAHLHPEMVKGNKIVLCGGGLSGADSALELAEKGKDVTIIEMRDGIAIDTAFINRQSIMKKITEHGIKALTNTTVKAITSDGVKVTDANGNESLVPADTVITAFGVKARNQLAESIQDVYPDAIIIGDCDKVGNIGTAIHQGFKRAYSLA